MWCQYLISRPLVMKRIFSELPLDGVHLGAAFVRPVGHSYHSCPSQAIMEEKECTMRGGREKNP